jgi:hypothetical protein
VLTDELLSVWRALAKAYGNEGLEGSHGDYANIGWNTWLRLRDYKRGALIEERASGSWHDPTTGRRARITGSTSTGAGWVLYEREWARYRELYPDVDAPDPKRVGAAVGERS